LADIVRVLTIPAGLDKIIEIHYFSNGQIRCCQSRMDNRRKTSSPTGGRGPGGKLQHLPHSTIRFNLAVRGLRRRISRCLHFKARLTVQVKRHNIARAALAVMSRPLRAADESDASIREGFTERFRQPHSPSPGQAFKMEDRTPSPIQHAQSRHSPTTRCMDYIGRIGRLVPPAPTSVAPTGDGKWMHN